MIVVLFHPAAYVLLTGQDNAKEPSGLSSEGSFFLPSPLRSFHFPETHRESARSVCASAAGVLCAEHVRQLGGASPLPSLMEAKG